jgi:hypothetical protein
MSTGTSGTSMVVGAVAVADAKMEVKVYAESIAASSSSIWVRLGCE